MNYNLLKGKRGIISGALDSNSIAWKVAERAVEEGAIITLSNTPLAVRMGTTNELGEKLHAEIIPADATSVADLENVFAPIGFIKDFDRMFFPIGIKLDFLILPQILCRFKA